MVWYDDAFKIGDKHDRLENGYKYTTRMIMIYRLDLLGNLRDSKQHDGRR